MKESSLVMKYGFILSVWVVGLALPSNSALAQEHLLGDNPAAVSDYKRAQSIVSKAGEHTQREMLFDSCDKDSAIGCAKVTRLVVPEQSRDYADRAWSLARAECKEDVPASCISLAYVEATLGNNAVGAKDILTRGCNENDGMSCETLSRYYSATFAPYEEGMERDANLAEKYALRSCDLNWADGCVTASNFVRRYAVVDGKIIVEKDGRDAFEKRRALFRRALAIDSNHAGALSAMASLETEKYLAEMKAKVPYPRR